MKEFLFALVAGLGLTGHGQVPAVNPTLTVQVGSVPPEAGVTARDRRATVEETRASGWYMNSTTKALPGPF